MDFPRLSPKQRVASVALIAIGLSGLCFGASQPGYGAWQPFALMLGLTCVSFGVIATIAHRFHVALVVLTLAATFVGGAVGGNIWEANHPGLELRPLKGAEEQFREIARQRGPYTAWGSVLGASVVPLAAAAFSAIRKRSDLEPPVGDPEPAHR